MADLFELSDLKDMLFRGTATPPTIKSQIAMQKGKPAFSGQAYMAQKRIKEQTNANMLAKAKKDWATQVQKRNKYRTDTANKVFKRYPSLKAEEISTDRAVEAYERWKPEDEKMSSEISSRKTAISDYNKRLPALLKAKKFWESKAEDPEYGYGEELPAIYEEIDTIQKGIRENKFNLGIVRREKHNTDWLRTSGSEFKNRPGTKLRREEKEVSLQERLKYAHNPAEAKYLKTLIEQNWDYRSKNSGRRIE